MRKKIIISCSVFLFLIASLAFIYKNIMGFGYLQFGDESGHFLGGMAIHQGDILYRDYVDAHGPLVFTLTWLVGLFVGYSKIAYLRFASTLCTILASAAIFYSPLFKETWQRYISVAIWLGMLTNVWIVQGLYLDSYWPIAGALTVIALATIILPINFNVIIPKTQAFYGGFAVMLLPFTAYSFAPIFLLFLGIVILAYFYNKTDKVIPLSMYFYGSLSAFIIMIIWLIIYADIGGMIAFHFIANQFWYSQYIPLNLYNFLNSLIPSLDSDKLIGSLAVISFIISCVLLFLKNANKICTLLLIIAILSLQFRGGFLFQDGAFVMASIGTLTLTLIYYLTNKSPFISISFCICIPVTTMMVAQHAVGTPAAFTLKERRQIIWRPIQKSNSPKMNELRKYVQPNERILTLPYAPDFYIYLDRLPIPKYHAYLPWEADYAAHPWHGYTRDICVDLPKAMPPLIYFDNWVVWGQYAPKQFMPCVLTLLKDHYIALPNHRSIYIRNDRFQEINHIQ